MIDNKDRVSIFQLLEIPVRTTMKVDQDMGDMDDPDNSALRDQINSWLDSDLNPDEENEVKVIVAAFQSIRFKTVHVKTNTVELSFMREREQLKKQLAILLPFSIENFDGMAEFSIG